MRSDERNQHVTRGLGLAIAATVVVAGLAGAAQASPVPPAPAAALLGNWVNTNSATTNVKQVIIDAGDAGTISVDGFGACSPTLCEWGSVPATIYATGDSAKTGATFQSKSRIYVDGQQTSRTFLFGRENKTKEGPRLTLHEFTVYDVGEQSANEITETFEPGPAQQADKVGSRATTYGYDFFVGPPAGLRGTWKPVHPGGSLTSLKIGGPGPSPIVQAAGACTTGSCYLGRTRTINFAKSDHSKTGHTLFAPLKLSNRLIELTIVHSDHNGVERLEVGEFIEFIDGSGHSNYRVIETLTRA